MSDQPLKKLQKWVGGALIRIGMWIIGAGRVTIEVTEDGEGDPWRR